MTLADRISVLNMKGSRVSKYPNAYSDDSREKLYNLNCFKCLLGATMPL